MSGSLALGSEEAWWTVCKVSRHHIYLFIYLFISDQWYIEKVKSNTENITE